MNWSDIPIPHDPDQAERSSAIASAMQALAAQAGAFPSAPPPDLPSWFIPGAQPPSLPSRPACGSCSVCCVVLEVPEVGTAEWSPCQYQCAAGCLIHARKPDRCREYGCMWRLGIVRGEEYRPDRLSALYTVRGWVGLGMRYVDVQVVPRVGMDMARISGLNVALARRGWSIWLRIGDGPALGMGPPDDVKRINYLLGLDRLAEEKGPG